MLEALATLLVFQTIGQVLSYLLRLPIPGPVLGMVLLLVVLMVRPAAVTTLRPTSLELLKHLSLLFVPAGVGVHAARGASWHRSGCRSSSPSLSVPLWRSPSRRWSSPDRPPLRAR